MVAFLSTPNRYLPLRYDEFTKARALELWLILQQLHQLGVVHRDVRRANCALRRRRERKRMRAESQNM